MSLCSLLIDFVFPPSDHTCYDLWHLSTKSSWKEFLNSCVTHAVVLHLFGTNKTWVYDKKNTTVKSQTHCSNTALKTSIDCTLHTDKQIKLPLKLLSFWDRLSSKKTVTDITRSFLSRQTMFWLRRRTVKRNSQTFLGQNIGSCDERSIDQDFKVWWKANFSRRKPYLLSHGYLHLSLRLCVFFGCSSVSSFRFKCFVELLESSFSLVCLLDIFRLIRFWRRAYLITKSDMTKKVTWKETVLSSLQ
jgi:hypothetical protein